jgi:hypothetical protein
MKFKYYLLGLWFSLLGHTHIAMNYFFKAGVKYV